jgi:hypothetical protein
VKKPAPAESIALDTVGSHISRRSQILVEELTTQPKRRGSRKLTMSIS